MAANPPRASVAPGIAKLLAAVDACDVNVVIVAKLDRLTRSVKDFCELLERFEQRGVSKRPDVCAKCLEQTKAGGVKSTKPEEPRWFGVPEWALDVLKEHRAEQDRDRVLFGMKYMENNLIFCQPYGSYYSPDRLGARVVEAMKKVGLEGVSFHSLRHSYASILSSKGVPCPSFPNNLVAGQNIPLSIYSHALPADSRAAAEIWNDSMPEVIASVPRSRTVAAAPAVNLRTGTE